jgi:cytosine/adenosine deaminase-related metal-dependent hydrolase
MALMAETGTGVSHCPTSNMRLGSGIAPVRAMRDAGIKVGLGVDGSASNDSGHLLAEARQAMLLQRVKLGASAMSAEEALWMGTRGGAAVLGRDDIGALAPGMAADFVGIPLDRLAFAGAQADPLAALVFCAPASVDLSVIDGRVVVEDGRLLTVDLPSTISHHNQLARELLERARS